MDSETPIADWIDVAGIEEIERGAALRVVVDGRTIAVFHLMDGEIRALDDSCPHAGFPLHQSEVEGHEVTCSLHHWIFSLDDGRCIFGARATRAHAARVSEGRVQIARPHVSRYEDSALARKINATIGAGISRTLPDLVQKALDAQAPLQQLLDAARAATIPELQEAHAAIARARDIFGEIPDGDIALAALRLATHSTPPDLPRAAPPPPPSQPSFRGEEGRHLRRRLVAALEKHDVAMAIDAVTSYLADRQNPFYLAQNLVRAALEHDPSTINEIVTLAARAYCWRAEDHAALYQALANLARPFDPDAHSR